MLCFWLFSEGVKRETKALRQPTLTCRVCSVLLKTLIKHQMSCKTCYVSRLSILATAKLLLPRSASTPKSCGAVGSRYYRGEEASLLESRNEACFGFGLFNLLGRLRPEASFRSIWSHKPETLCCWWTNLAAWTWPKSGNLLKEAMPCCVHACTYVCLHSVILFFAQLPAMEPRSGMPKR